MPANGNDNDNDNANDIIFTIKDTKLCSCSNFISKDLKDQFIGMNYNKKTENENTANEYRYFLQSNLVGVNRLFVAYFSNQDTDSKRFKTWKYYLMKRIIDNYNFIISGKNVYGQVIDSDIKPDEEMRKLRTGQRQFIID